MGWTDWLWIFRLARALIEALLSVDPQKAADRGLIPPKKSDEAETE